MPLRSQIFYPPDCVHQRWIYGLDRTGHECSLDATHPGIVQPFANAAWAQQASIVASWRNAVPCLLSDDEVRKSVLVAVLTTAVVATNHRSLTRLELISLDDFRGSFQCLNELRNHLAMNLQPHAAIQRFENRRVIRHVEAVAASFLNDGVHGRADR